METARRYCTDLEINLYSALLAPHDDSTRKFNRETFSDGGLLPYRPILITGTLLTYFNLFKKLSTDDFRFSVFSNENGNRKTGKGIHYRFCV